MQDDTKKSKSVSNSNYQLCDNWSLFKTEPDECSSPTEIDLKKYSTFSTGVPISVASAINGLEPNCWQPEYNYAEFDWWYLYKFESLTELDRINKNNKIKLCFDGLATLCEVWLNNTLILTTNNMFRYYSVPLSQAIQPNDQLALVFRSVTHNLKQKRPRPRWKTKLVENQQMRWIRSTVLGHVPMWTPPIQMIGPWKKIYLQEIKNFDVTDFKITSNYIDQHAELAVSASLTSQFPTLKINTAYLKLEQKVYPLEVVIGPQTVEISLKQKLEDIERWWPHTHGEPRLYQYQVCLETNNGKQILGTGKIGFKSTKFNLTDEKSEICINEQPIFCRGTCWTVSDYLSLNANRKDLNNQLTLMRDAGLNMIRVGGTMVYESDDFYQLCDQLGILVWQDFMFASMDYPVDDSLFLENIKIEVNQQLNRLSRHPCITVYCGNTDVQAQAAMYGIPEENWSNHFFDDWLALSCEKRHTGIPYFSSSPIGGVLPFHLSQGVSHFWGIGAYMHPTTDTDKTRVLFASEGMGLSHIPEDSTIQQSIGKSSVFPYSNEWTKRIPRDLGAGWDFDDIRDKYLEELFKVDPILLRRQNVEKYIELSRVVTGEVISQVFQYWRSYKSKCQGGLIWFNRDFWPCAGFGLLDSNNLPKAAYYQLKRVWANQTVIIQNEGLDGANISLINENKQPFTGVIEIELLKDNHISIAKTQRPVEVNGNDTISLSVDKLLGRFYDSGYAYKFGPSQFDILVCKLLNESGSLVSESFMFAESFSLPTTHDAIVTAVAEPIDDNRMQLTIRSDRFLQFVRICTNNYLAEDNYFHICPGDTKVVNLKKHIASDRRFKGSVEAVNLINSVKIKL